MNRRFEFKITGIQFIILFLIIIGFFLRIKDIGIQSLWLDEAITSIAATSFLEKGIPLLPSGILYERGILNTFLIAFSFKIFGINEFAARLPSILFGTLMILLAYVAGSKFGNRRIGVIAALLVTFSVMEIAWSRQARMYQQLQFFYILSLYLFYEFTRNKSLKVLILLVFSVLATIMSHEFGYALIPVFMIYLIVSAIGERNIMKKVRRKIIILVFFVFLTFLSFAYFKGVIPFVLGTEINYYEMYIYILKDELGIFLFLAVPGGTVIINKDWKKGLLLITALIIPLYFIFFHVLLLGTRYLFFVIPILFILVGYFIDFIIGLLSRLHGMNARIHDTAAADVLVAVLLILTMYFSPAFTFTPEEKYELGVNAPLSDFKKAYTYVKENMSPDDVVVSAWTPPAWFYLGKSDYWLAFDVVGTGTESFMISNTSREIYTNATAIGNVEELINLTRKHERGWIVVDTLAWYKLSPGIREYIRNNTDQQLYDTTIRVYMWNGTVLSPAATGQ